MKKFFKKIIDFFITSRIRIRKHTKMLYVNVPKYGTCILKYNKQDNTYDVYDDYKNYLCSIPYNNEDGIDLDLIEQEIINKLSLNG